MESTTNPAPLICIVGCTASGKSALAYHIATRYDGEIIATDSRTIYKGMDIGTAKPSLEQRGHVPHHLIDIIEPNKNFTAADFKQHAQEAAVGIARRGALPILVGGTGLYVDAFLFDFSFRKPHTQNSRQELEKLSVEELQSLLRRKGIPLPYNERNPRHLIRSLETEGAGHSARHLRPRTLILGLAINKEVLRERIKVRVEAMFEQGLQAEVTSLVRQYGWEAPGLQTIGYQEWREFFEGTIEYDQVKERIFHNTCVYAKRQTTWFKRNKSIHWLSDKENIEDLITTLLSK